MPASMISDVTGSKPKVIGRSMAMVAVGPMPGSTPTAVPRATPRRQKSRFVGVKAVSKPSARLSKTPIDALPLQPGAEVRQPELQRDHEDQDAESGETAGDHDGGDHTRPVSRQRRQEHRPEQRRDQPQPPDRVSEEEEGGHEQGERLPRDRADVVTVGGDESLDGDEDPEDD